MVCKSRTVILKVLAFLMFFGCGVSFAQLGTAPERSALKNIEKHRWEKAEFNLRRTLRKDTVNASLRYILSVFYFKTSNPSFNLDSAYHYAVTALQDYQITSARERDKLRRVPLDSIQLIRLEKKSTVLRLRKQEILIRKLLTCNF